MRAHLKSLGKDTAVYGFASAAMSLVPAVTLPVYARAFAPSQFAILDLATVTYALLLQILDLGLISGAQRIYFDEGEDHDSERVLVISTALVITMTMSLAAGCAFMLLPAQIAKFVFGSARHSGLIMLLGLTLPAAMAANFLRSVMRLGFQKWHYLIASLGGAICSAAVGIVAVTGLQAGVGGVLAGQLAGFAGTAVYSFALVRHRVQIRISGRHLRAMLGYGLPLIPTAAAIGIVSMIDRYMVQRLSTLEQLGQYAVANRVTQLLPLVVLGFSTAYSPWLLRLWSQDPELERRVRGRTLTLVAILVCYVGMTVTLFARELIGIVAPQYGSAYEAVGPVLIGVGAYALCSITAAGMSLSRKTWWMMIISSLGALANVGLNLVLIPDWGMLGAATATAIAFGLIAGLYYLQSQRLYPTPYEPTKVLRAIGIALAAGAVGVIPFSSLVVALLVKLAIVALFPVSLLAAGVIDRREATWAWGRVRRTVVDRHAHRAPDPVA